MQPPPVYECHVPNYLSNAVTGFLRDAMQWDIQERTTGRVEIDINTV